MPLLPEDFVGHKWNPGHYMLTWWGDQPQSAFDVILNEPLIKGVKARYLWKWLEPEFGKYDFTMIEKDLDYLQSFDKRLCIYPYYMYNRSPIPDYIKNDAVYGGVINVGNREIPKIWLPAVMDRLIALYQALGRWFNREPFIEAVNTQETSVAIGSDIKKDPGSGYSDKGYVEQLKRLIVEAKKAWPNTVIYKNTNFMAGNSFTVMQDFVHFAYENHIGIGGPDIVPGKDSTAQKIAREYFGKMPLSFDVQAPSLGGHEGAFLPKELLDHGVDYLNINHFYWISQGEQNGEEYSFEHGIVPAINQSHGKINAGCPDNLGRCYTDYVPDDLEPEPDDPNKRYNELVAKYDELLLRYEGLVADNELLKAEFSQYKRLVADSIKTLSDSLNG